MPLDCQVLLVKVPITLIMTPIKPGTPINDKDPFSQWLVVFESAMDVYDHAVKERERALALCESATFQEIYRARGFPPYYRFYDFSKFQKEPTVVLSTSSAGDRQHRPPTITEYLADLEDAYKAADGRTRKKHENRFFERVLLARCSAIDRYSSLTYQASVSELIRRVRREKDREALIALVELDGSFLTAPFVEKRIREAEIGNNSAFKRHLAEALLIDQRTQDGRYYTIRPVKPKQPDGKRGANNARRNRYALSIALAIGLDGQTEDQIAYFFGRYNDLIGGAIQRNPSDAFDTYRTKGAIHQALRTFHLKKKPARIGRPKGRSLGSTESSDK
jgi:hypothetical protein